MPTLAIDSRNTFANAILMAAGPKLEYGTGAQAVSAQGVPKWELQIAVSYLTEPGQRAQSDVLAVTVTSLADPVKDIPVNTPVEFDGLRVGWSAPQQRDNGKGISGGKPWYQANSIRPAHGVRKDAAA